MMTARSKLCKSKRVWRLICTQLGQLTIRHEPLLGVTASAARQSLHLTPNKGAVCIFRDSVFILYPLAACAPCCFRPRHRRFKWTGPYGTDGPARSPLNPADFPQCLTLSTLINPYTSPRHMVGLVFTQGSPLSTHTHTHIQIF